MQSGANLDQQEWFAEALRAAVARGGVPQSRIDDMIRPILRSLFAVGAIDHPAQRHGDIDYMAHRVLAQREAEQGIVLLKNRDAMLPLCRAARRADCNRSAALRLLTRRITGTRCPLFILDDYRFRCSVCKKW
ncbi:hypothetical protein [Duffyella gerundensis]|uniref:hypothetical protein n=1 Tax=Duffyella TaxID=3026546 RepID=UPI003F6DD1CC